MNRTLAAGLLRYNLKSNDHMKRYLTVLFLSAALAGSVSVKADEHRTDNQSKRYYDKDARDYHEWNQNENQVYHQYLTDNHKRDRDFAKTTRGEKKNYFKWRHDRSDQDKH